MQNSFIHNSYVSSIDCIENTFDAQIYRKMQNSYDIRSFIRVSNMFSMHDILCVKCTNLWMNKLCTIFIINLSHVKFMMQTANTCGNCIKTLHIITRKIKNRLINKPLFNLCQIINFYIKPCNKQKLNIFLQKQIW
jgi:hypothetical protein